MLFSSIGDLSENCGENYEICGEISPGVTLERRRLLLTALGAAALACVPGRSRGQTPPSAPLPVEASADPLYTRLTFDAISRDAERLAAALTSSDAPNEDAYLFDLTSKLARLERTPDAKFAGNDSFEMAASHRAWPLIVYQIRLAPGATIALHDHRDYNGILLGVEGEARCRNFDIQRAEGEPVEPDPVIGREFLIRETSSSILMPGRASTLSRTRENIHEIVAGDRGARLLDVFTFFSKDAQSHWIEFDDKPIDPVKRIYRVAWKS